MENPPKSTSEPSVDALSVLLSRQRTTMLFQRTQLSAELTLMSISRTPLSLIGFGFTIFQASRSMKALVEIDLKKDPGELAGKLELSMIGYWHVVSEHSGSCRFQETGAGQARKNGNRKVNYFRRYLPDLHGTKLLLTIKECAGNGTKMN